MLLPQPKELAEYTTGQINELPTWYKLKQPDIHKKLLRNGGLMTLVKSSQYKRQSALAQKALDKGKVIVRKLR